MENKEEKEIKVGIIIHDSTNPFLIAIHNSLEKNISKKFTSIIIDSNADPYLQERQVKTFLREQHVDALIIDAVDIQMMPSFSDWAKKSDVPLIFFHREPSIETLRSYPKSCFVGGDSTIAGSMQGDLIKYTWDSYLQKKKKKGDTTINYVVLQGNGLSKTAMQRLEYAMKRATELGLTLKQVRPTYFCNWSRDLAKEAMLAYLSEGVDDIDLILASNDALALGAVEALEEIGYNLPGNFPNKFISIIGFDGYPEAINAVQSKRMMATVKQRGDEIGRVIAKVVENAIDNKPFSNDTGYTWDESGASIRIPFTSITLLK